MPTLVLKGGYDVCTLEIDCILGMDIIVIKGAISLHTSKLCALKY